MIKHIVLFRFKEPQSSENQMGTLSEISVQLNELTAHIPELLAIETGININPSENYHLALTTTFENMEGLTIYAKHPAHLEVAKKIRQNLEQRACVDYEL